MSDLCRRSFIGICRGGIIISDLCRRSFIGICRGGIIMSDLCRAVLSVFAEEVSL